MNDYFHYRSFVIAFKYGNRKRALQEAQLMGDEFKRKNRKKIIAAHSALLTALWNWYKKV